ncbi:MAG: DNA recombination protein RmuC [Candidatus Brennerbacteria bacterium]|nr:DNA recombination protein RmuC [Candidatus Brennerbacteria bacterium]
MSVGLAIFISVAALALGIAIAFFLRRPREKTQVLEFAEKMIGDLDRRLEAMQKAIDERIKETSETASKVSERAYGHVADFSKGITSLEEKFKQLHEKVDKVTSFQDLFKTPKTTGKWGEAQLNHILGEYFERNLWEAQHFFKNGEAVDAVIKLPNGKLLPIDSKLNFTSFEKMVGAAGPDSEKFTRDFVGAVKEEIDAIASKYVNPSEGTTDMAIMFISAESVYYEIVNALKDEDLTSYAWRKKVILTSPNTLYITLQTLLHWFSQSRLQKDLKGIFERLEGIKKDAMKLQDEFRKLGTHLGNADKVYREFDHRLGLLTDRVSKVIKVGEEFKEIEEPRAKSRLLE